MYLCKYKHGRSNRNSICPLGRKQSSKEGGRRWRRRWHIIHVVSAEASLWSLRTVRQTRPDVHDIVMKTDCSACR